MKTFRHPAVKILVFLLPLLYWCYLGFVTQMVVVHDAAGYENYGRGIYERGWKDYFQTGPHREPLYPWLVSQAMHLADSTGLPHQSVLVYLQILILLGSLCLVFCLLRKLMTSPLILFGSILYLGFSPAFINSALALFSEISTYPFILLIILASPWPWRAIRRGSVLQQASCGLLLGTLFFGATCARGVYEFVFLLFLTPYLVKLCFSFRKPQIAKGLGFFILSAVLSFQGFILPYKMVNKTLNGHWTFTDRGARLLYGAIARRTTPMSPEYIWAGLVSTPGEEYCYKAASQEACTFWGCRTTNGLADKKEAELALELDHKHWDREFLNSTMRDFKSAPGQIILLTLLEVPKLFFWESTRVGFVVYPDWLDKIYDFFPLKMTLEFLVALLSLTAFFAAIARLLRRRQNLFSCSENSDQLQMTLFICIIIFGHISLYALCSAGETRHALPIAPLHLILIATFLQSLADKSS